MLQELLMCLAGCTSRLLDLRRGAWGDFEKYVQPTERVIVGRILNIAEMYREIRLFIDKYKRITIHTNHIRALVEEPASTSEPEQDENDLQHGLYLEAFCFGLEDASKDYLQCIADLELQILEDRNTVLTFILLTVERHYEQLRTLLELIRVVQTRRERPYHGCVILELVHDRLAWTVSHNRGYLVKIIKVMNSVFYTQIVYWLLYGQLNDGYNEFFIEPVPDDEDKTNSSPGIKFSPFTEEQLKLMSKTYRINTTRFPSFMPPDLGEKILTIGTTVRMFLNDPRRADSEQTEVSYLWKRETQVYETDLFALRPSPFNSFDLHKIIEPLRICITERLWTVAMKEAHLTTHFRNVRDYVLIGRGDIFQEFLKICGSCLRKEIQHVAIESLNNMLEDAITSINPYSDLPMENIKIYFLPGQPKSDIVWNALRIKYTVPWPLHLMFSPKIIDGYAALFNYLLRIKHVHMTLNKLWVHQADRRTKCKVNPKVWKLRNKCSHVIDNLLYYLQVDVIETQFNILMDLVEKTQDFLAISKAHDEFMSAIIHQSFLNELHKEELTKEQLESLRPLQGNPVLYLLQVIIKTIEEFCRGAATWEITLSDLQQAELAEWNHMIDELANMLLQLWDDVHGLGIGKYLSRLLMRLDVIAWKTASPREHVRQHFREELMKEFRSTDPIADYSRRHGLGIYSEAGKLGRR